MKRFISTLLLLIIYGCNNSQTSENQAKQNLSNCSNKSTVPLESQDAKPVALGEQTVLETGIVNQSKFVGYTFQGKAGERLNYQTNQDICVLVFTPGRQLLYDPILPTTGRYTIQVAAVKGSTTFELKMSLGNAKAFSFQPTQQNVKLAYNVTTSPTFQHSQKLQGIINELLNLAAAKGMPQNALSITLINVNTGEFADYQQEQLRYPASVAKLFWMTLLYGELQKGILQDEQAFTGDLEKMLVKSDNEAASRIIDQITETTSGSKLVGKDLQTWLSKRYQMNSFFEQAGYGMIDISQKTFPIPSEKLYEPKGRDLQMRGDLQKPIRNKITTQQVARLMYEIVKEQAVSPEYSKKMAGWLSKDLNLEIWQKLDPNAGEFNPVRTFFGESLPKDVYFLSKAGWTSSTRQEVAFIKTNNGKNAYILAIFAEDKTYAKDGNIFPKMSRLVFDRMVNGGEIASAKSASFPEQSNQSLGWIRIGAVDKGASNTLVGEPLVSTAIPISISSPTVPPVGKQVTLSVAANLRKTPPQPPKYELIDKIGISQPGQKIVIRKLEAFIDPNTNPAYKTVWAEVGSP
ncbi:hypothetical protein DSM106972_092880 [Dulcicalothrix desertica PCC 7102]|uniref:Beta-lactamase class A catalytic domain-containing protein n=1 Tax=Dulcicalothrix desertica PCC 7102 TaxID=232991 RepID=A0A433ULB3_9CYAN|nr:serine hydrolase [Dulcicalothrix desertica]RUS94651.1 hypothetical protein DSM106972_092880 [Dulcicalothrix desertica PCC 7102]TWH62545.1 beta-lactamase family protein [Dulcicalothrix desertica PCC 7102]